MTDGLFISDLMGTLVFERSGWDFLRKISGMPKNYEAVRTGEMTVAEYRKMEHDYFSAAGISSLNIHEPFEKITVRPGTREMLEEARSRGFYTVVLSEEVEAGLRVGMRKIGFQPDRSIGFIVDFDGSGLYSGVRFPYEHNGHSSKYLAVKSLHQEMKPRSLIYVGDAWNEVEAMKYVNEVGGLTIGMSPDEHVRKVAKVTVDSPTEAIAHIRRLGNNF